MEQRYQIEAFIYLRAAKGKLLSEGSIFYDYFNRRLQREPSYLLVLKEELYQKILTIEDVDKELQENKMYIPKIESWHFRKLKSI